MALEGAGGLLYATLFRHNAGNLGKKLCYPTKFREFAKIYCKTDRGGGYNVCRQDSRTLRGLDDETGGNKMKWIKRFAAGFLAAAMSLALLCGCSGSDGVLANAKEIEPGNSMWFRHDRWEQVNSGSNYTRVYTDELSGKKLIVSQADFSRCYVGTEQNGILRVNSTEYYYYGGEDADKNTLQVGFYEVDREGKTYKSIQEVKGVERVLTDLNLCWGRGRPSDPVRIPLKMRAGSYVKKNTLYYVESAEFESGTAIIYYPTASSEDDVSNSALYVDVYLPGKSGVQAHFTLGTLNHEAYTTMGEYHLAG